VEGIHCKKKVSGFPVPNRDVTYQTLPWPGIIKLFPASGEFGDIPAGGPGGGGDPAILFCYSVGTGFRVKFLPGLSVDTPFIIEESAGGTEQEMGF
jgi:hypothetical protein